MQKLLEDVDARVSRILLQPQSVQKENFYHAVWLSQTLMSDMTSQERRLLHLYVRNAPATSPRQTRPRGRSDEQPPRRESLAKREQRLHFSLFPRIVELQ